MCHYHAARAAEVTASWHELREIRAAGEAEAERLRAEVDDLRQRLAARVSPAAAALGAVRSALAVTGTVAMFTLNAALWAGPVAECCDNYQIINRCV